MEIELSREELLSRIVRVPDVCHGTPVVRGMRWPVYVVLGLIASGASNEEIIDDHPELTEADLRACLLYASEVIQKDQRSIAA